MDPKAVAIRKLLKFLLGKLFLQMCKSPFLFTQAGRPLKVPRVCPSQAAEAPRPSPVSAAEARRAAKGTAKPVITKTSDSVRAVALRKVFILYILLFI